MLHNHRMVIGSTRNFSTVSKPNPISNIRTVRYEVDPKHSLTRCQLEVRRLQATLVWNEFWTKHNAEYNARLADLKARHEQSGEVPSKDMSAFYRDHLNATRANHRDFNKWWIKENFALLFAGARCWVSERLPERKEPGFFGGH